MIMCLQGQGQGGRGPCLGQGQADDDGVTWRERERGQTPSLLTSGARGGERRLADRDLYRHETQNVEQRESRGGGCEHNPVTVT